MAIKVIKHGKKVFRTVCPICGCEFEYEKEDLTEVVDKKSITYDAKVRVVKCPECEEEIKHSDYRESYSTWPTYPNTQSGIEPGTQTPWTSNYPNIIYTTKETVPELDCDKCPNKPDWSKPQIGDTPCTWCRKMQPTCTSAFEKFQKNL